MWTSDLEKSPLKNLPLEKIASGSHLVVDERDEVVHDESDSMALLAGPSDQIKKLVSSGQNNQYVMIDSLNNPQIMNHLSPENMKHSQLPNYP